MNKVIMILSLIFSPLPVSLSICYSIKKKEEKNKIDNNIYTIKRPTLEV